MRPQSHLQLDVCTGGACAFSVCEHMGLSGKNFSCLCPTFLPYWPPVHWSDRVCISFSICQDVNVGLVLGPPDGGSSRTLPPKRQHGSRDTHPPGRLAALHTYTRGNRNWCERITCPYGRQPGSRPNIVLVVPTSYASITTIICDQS